MKIVSFLNSKGGVGKTTLAANVGVAVAQRGRKVLLIDLDSQGSLTNCFYSPDGWQPETSDSPTIKHWFDFLAGERGAVKLADLVLFPPVVRSDLARKKGMLGLIPANNALVDTEISLAAELGCRSCGKRQSPSAFVSVHGQLEEGIRKGGLSEYDLIIIDCSPAFSVLTRTAVIASDHVLVPARPDYLSVYGLAAFSHRLREIVSTYNSKLVAAGGRKNDPGRATADVLGVVFTMAGVHRDAPIQSSRDPMSRVHALELHVFDSVIRENKTAFTEAVQKLRPVVLMDLKRKGPGRELRDLADEFVAKLWGGKRG